MAAGSVLPLVTAGKNMRYLHPVSLYSKLHAERIKTKSRWRVLGVDVGTEVVGLSVTLHGNKKVSVISKTYTPMEFIQMMPKLVRQFNLLGVVFGFPFNREEENKTEEEKKDKSMKETRKRLMNEQIKNHGLRGMEQLDFPEGTTNTVVPTIQMLIQELDKSVKLYYTFWDESSTTSKAHRWMGYRDKSGLRAELERMEQNSALERMEQNPQKPFDPKKYRDRLSSAIILERWMVKSDIEVEKQSPPSDDS